jgi:uncharacterized protein YciI
MYALVLFRRGRTPETDEITRAHEAFITGLIRRQRILLGGPLATAAGPFSAAYLLRCDSLEEASEIANADPYFREGVYRPEIVRWDLVGVDPEAIDPELSLSLDPDESGQDG